MCRNSEGLLLLVWMEFIIQHSGGFTIRFEGPLHAAAVAFNKTGHPDRRSIDRYPIRLPSY